MGLGGVCPVGGAVQLVLTTQAMEKNLIVPAKRSPE